MKKTYKVGAIFRFKETCLKKHVPQKCFVGMQGTLQTIRYREVNTEMSVTGKVAYVNGDIVVVKISHIDKTFIKYRLTAKKLQSLMPECNDIPESISARYICFNAETNTFFLPCLR